jgi:hypothetical protein
MPILKVSKSLPFVGTVFELLLYELKAGVVFVENFTPCFDAALSRSWVLLVNSAGRSQPASLNINALGRSSPSQIGSKVAYSWPM